MMTYQLSILRKKCEEALEGARAAEEAQQLRLIEQQKWNSTLMESEQVRGTVQCRTEQNKPAQSSYEYSTPSY